MREERRREGESERRMEGESERGETEGGGRGR